MININKVVLIGRLTKDIELRKTQSNTSVASFTLAVDRPKRRDAEQETDFISCVAWSHSADFLSNYASKGTIVSVEGKIQTRSYDGQNGKVYVTEVIADNVQIISNQSTKQETKSEEPKQEVKQESIPSNNLTFDTEELPFY